jgi:hypothetical protein
MTECNICYTNTKNKKKICCFSNSKCSFIICKRCFIKVIDLEEEEVSYTCPNCRQKSIVNKHRKITNYISKQPAVLLLLIKKQNCMINKLNDIILENEYQEFLNETNDQILEYIIDDFEIPNIDRSVSLP